METLLKEKTEAPDFSLPDPSGVKVSLSDFRGKWVVLYFYPKDDTPGCTEEALDFTELAPELRKNGTVVIGISPDSETSHEKFVKKHGLTLILLSDADHQAIGAYGVWQKKSMYGREYMGVARTTYLIDPKGFISRVWEGVKVKGHAESVKDFVCSLKK